ncbi:MAG: extracellular solute-binding protein [Tyzzerella sp.]|nr:extracellular solute-binding protein [Tyzzerella sp.]
MKTMKKILAILLSLAMVFALTACGGDDTKTGGGKGSGDGDKKEALQVSEPVTIEFWHTLTADGAAALEAMTKEFNETNEYGITVNATNQGAYDSVLSKTIASHGTATAPTISLVGAGGIEQLAESGVVADMAAYVERDNYDLSNIPESLRYYMEYYEGQVIEFPYLVSSAVLVYNKDLIPTAPTTLEEWVASAEAVTKANPGVYGMTLAVDSGFYQRPILTSLGAPGLTSEDGLSPAGLDDGALEKLLTDWKGWIDDGFCLRPSVTDFETKSLNQFADGKLASYVVSSATLHNLRTIAKDKNINYGITKAVGYGGYSAGIGGGGLVVLDSATQQEQAAAWEYIKFLYEDDNIVTLHKATSYLPFTYSSQKSEELAAYWEENPEFAVVVEQLEWATYNIWSGYLAEWRTQVKNCTTSVVVDGSMTVDAVIKFLQQQATVIFP